MQPPFSPTRTEWDSRYRQSAGSSLDSPTALALPSQTQTATWHWPLLRSRRAFVRGLEPWFKELCENDYPSKPWHAERTERQRALVSCVRWISRTYGPQSDHAQFLSAAREASNVFEL